MSLEKISEKKSHGGKQLRYKHLSSATKTEMHFSVFLPDREGKCPTLWYLSGLTCSDLNVVEKSGFQKAASEEGVIVICPDTSPRGAEIQGEDESWDFGSGAGFYLNATAAPWSTNYNMERYVCEELQELLAQELPIDTSAQGIFGHSMGGHGALVLALRHPELYSSVSAFSPICAPSQVPWGQKAFSTYLSSEAEWQEHDATALILSGRTCSEILVDQGTADSFLAQELRPELLQAACEKIGQKLELRMQEGYDHSYYFIASFMEDHIRFHAKQLR